LKINSEKMATSSLARDFRKINIEQYDEDFYVEDDYSQGAGAPDEGAVQMAITGGKPLDALKAALSQNPSGSSDAQLKLRCTEVSVRAKFSESIYGILVGFACNGFTQIKPN
jgi:hypothetical protein